MTIATQAAAPGLLVVSEIYESGWRVCRWRRGPDPSHHHALRGVPIPSGEHTVEMRYDPLSLRLGLWISGIATAAMVVPSYRRWSWLSGRVRRQDEAGFPHLWMTLSDWTLKENVTCCPLSDGIPGADRHSEAPYGCGRYRRPACQRPLQHELPHRRDATSYYVNRWSRSALEAEELLWIGRQMDVACARFTTFLQERTCSAIRRATSASPTGTPWSSWRGS